VKNEVSPEGEKYSTLKKNWKTQIKRRLDSLLDMLLNLTPLLWNHKF
jgi:hypothetical protein